MPARFENLVASHLLEWVDYQTDTQGRAIELRFFRDVDGPEVDFVVTDRAGATVFAAAVCHGAGLANQRRWNARFHHTGRHSGVTGACTAA